MSDETRSERASDRYATETELRALHAEHRAEVAQRASDLRVEVVDRINKSVGIAGAIGAIVFASIAASGAWFLFEQIGEEVERRTTADAVDALIEKRLRAPLSALDKEVSRLREREELLRLMDRAIGNDDGAAFAQLFAGSDSESDTERALDAQLQSYMNGLIWKYNGVSLRPDHEGRSPQELLDVFRTAPDPWSRAAAGARIARSDLPEAEIARALLAAMTQDASAIVRYYAWYELVNRFRPELDAAGIVTFDPPALEKHFAGRPLSGQP